MEAILIVWFSRHCIDALSKVFITVPALPLPNPKLVAPYNILHGMYTAFDLVFLVAVLSEATERAVPARRSATRASRP